MNDMNKLYLAAAEEDRDTVLDSLEEYEECDRESLLDDLIMFAARGDRPAQVEFMRVLIAGRCNY